MTIVSTTEFWANQTKYIGLVDRGERVILRSRAGRWLANLDLTFNNSEIVVPIGSPNPLAVYRN